jgi:pantetheine-phosphate adenylyltransferase
MLTAVYPGTFDPLTRGHEDLVRRASGLFDKLVVGVADSKAKSPFFSLDERMEIAHEVLGHYPNVHVESFSGLLKDFVRRHVSTSNGPGWATCSGWMGERCCVVLAWWC